MHGSTMTSLEVSFIDGIKAETQEVHFFTLSVFGVGQLCRVFCRCWVVRKSLTQPPQILM